MGNRTTRESPENTYAIRPSEQEVTRSLIKGFFQEPSLDRFNRILQYDSYHRQRMKETYDIFLRAVYEKWHLGEGNPSVADGNNIRHLWVLFHATGDQQYVRRVEDIAKGKIIIDGRTQEAARKTYEKMKPYLQKAPLLNI